MKLGENKKIKAVIFDCDGTLVDSEHSHFLGWQYALKKLGIHFTPEEYISLSGKSAEANAQYLAKKLGLGSAIEILKDKQNFFHSLQSKKLLPIEATVNFMRRLAKEKFTLGIKLAVASAAHKSEILLNLKHLEILHLLDVVISGQDDLNDYYDAEGTNKPKPYIYLHTAKLLGVCPSECLAIEDSYSGVCAGADAGCFTVAIPNKYTRKHDFSRAHLKLDSLEEIGLSELTSRLFSSV